MTYAQALNAMFRGFSVGRRGKPGVRYSFDGAERYRVWAYVESRDDAVHIDNVCFDDMMASDWYVLPREGSKTWQVLNLLSHRRFTYVDVISMSVVSATLITPLWWVGSLACLGALLSFIFVERKWGTNV